jgi:hypothetical protein
LDNSILQSYSDGKSAFKVQPKKQGQVIGTIDTFKFQFTPISAAFNPSYDSYVAVWGRKDLQVLMLCPKQGIVK